MLTGHGGACTLPTALAAPVEEGMMLAAAPRPPRQSFLEGPSTVFCVAVVACTVVIRPSTISKFSWTTCTCDKGGPQADKVSAKHTLAEGSST